ncbi:LamG domain-containing protein [Streptomyces sp. NPDC057638]|uniref:LamG domain-containing protein n=1 Tax=Streptomyces sp. NPDC057638 TaxID=3346190 RepID=UPI00368A0EFF
MSACPRRVGARVALVVSAMAAGVLSVPAHAASTPVPSAPRIVSTGVYQECLPNTCPGRGAPGVKGSFRITPDPADTDVTGYRWRLQSQQGAQRVTGADVVIEVRPTDSRLEVLEVEAIDAQGGMSIPARFAFKVSPPEGPRGRWHFDDSTPGSGVTTAADTGEAGPRHPLTLHKATGVADWSALGRGGTGDHSLRLNDDVTDPAKRTGYASTSAPPLNTRDSFTVSAWVRLNDGGATRVVVAAPGTKKTDAFSLAYSGTAKKWVFRRGVADSDTPAYISSFATAANPPLRVWTHLTGVFDTQGDTDSANDTIQLHVNGRPQGAPVVLATANPAYTPWTSSAGMTVGASATGEQMVGRIDELALWQRPLMPSEVAVESRYEVNGVPAVEQVAYWNTSSAANGRVPELTAYAPGALVLSPTGAVADPAANEVRLDGTSGHLSTTGPVVDETGAFTVTTAVKLDGAKMRQLPVGGRAQVFGQASAVGPESTWAIWVERLAPEPDGFVWRFGRTATDATGKAVATGFTSSQEVAEFDTWVQVTGVYDPTATTQAGQTGKTALFIGAAPQAAGSTSAFDTPQHGAGALTAGRGSAKGVTGHYLPGSIREIRVWTGAMSRTHILEKVMTPPVVE